MAKKEILIPFVQYFEGGFVNDPADRGGATMKGVTLTTYRAVFGQRKTVNDLRSISDEDWALVFDKLFWKRWSADSIQTQAIANLLVDWTWNSGLYGIKIPQRVLGVKVDGLVGQKTIAAINGYSDQQELFNRLWQERKAFYERIARGAQAKFLKGWLNRLNGIRWNQLKYGRKSITW